MAGPDFPNVPAVPGVPAVKRGLDNLGGGTVPQLGSDEIVVTAAGRNQWGIYTSDGVNVLQPDSVIAVGYDAEHRIADFPIEEGGFESYDKVALPFDARVLMTKGGKLEERRAFLAAIEEIRGDLNLYNVITPERTYLNVNIVRVSIDRSREAGASMITADVHLREVREEVTTSFSATRDPASADDANNGSVQPQATTADPEEAK